MPSVSLLGRLTFGAGAVTATSLAGLGLTAPAHATASHHQRPASTARAAASGGPRVSSVVPALGAPGWPVTLSGSRFSHVTAVAFAGHSARFRVLSTTRISAEVPAGATSGPVTVTAKAGSGTGPVFTVTPAQTLEPGETLAPGESLVSKDGHFTLTMRSDGNLAFVVTGSHQTLWSSHTSGNPGAYLSLLSNGNLVLYARTGATTLWSTKTAGHGPARLVAQTNGNLTLYEGGTRTWTAGTLDNKLKPGQTLRSGWFLTSGTGYKLVMRKNGNLAETTKSGTVWQTRTTGNAGATVTMQSDGNLVLAGRGTLWTTRTAGHKRSRLIVQRSGVLAVRGQGKVWWASKSKPPPAVRLTLGKWPGKAGTAAAATYYRYPYPNPPACTGGGACHADKWAFYQGQCTSWVAYEANRVDGVAFTNSYGGHGRWGDAVNWAAQARSVKLTVNKTPTAGSIAWYGATRAAPSGHVVFVEKVNSPTSMVISEMNYDAHNGFWVHKITTASNWPDEFIHLPGH
jgi:surface antigen